MRIWQWRLLMWLSAGAMAYRANYKPFHNWQCDGCGDENGAAEETYRQVHQALRQRGAAREVYLLLDHSWIDRLLEPATKVIVKVVRRDRLNTTQLTQQEENNNPVQGDEAYVVVYSPPAEQTRANGYPVLRKKEAAQIDTFLVRNPCFVPLQDPPVTLSDSKMHPMGRRRSSTGVKRASGNDSPETLDSLIYEHSAIFVRLPSYPYHATCRLYTVITANQFPDRCPPSSHTDALEAYHLGNIGWVNNVYPMISKMQSALHNDRIFIMPRAQDNGRENTTEAVLYFRTVPKRKEAGEDKTEVGNAAYWKARGKNRKERALPSALTGVRGTWGAWADRAECPSMAHFAFDPWSCHFMTLSACHQDPTMQTVATREGYPDDPKNGSAYLIALVRCMHRQ